MNSSIIPIFCSIIGCIARRAGRAPWMGWGSRWMIRMTGMSIMRILVDKIIMSWIVAIKMRMI